MKTAENVKLSKLTSGMIVNQDIDCGKDQCPKYPGCKILSLFKKGRNLTSSDITLIKSNVKCFTKNKILKIKNEKDLEALLKRYEKGEIPNFPIMIETETHSELMFMPISELIKKTKEKPRGAFRNISIITEAEPEINVIYEKIRNQKQEHQTKHELKKFKQKLRGKTRNIYSEITKSLGGDSKLEIPKIIVEDVYTIVSELRPLFERNNIAESLAELNNDARDSFYDDVWDHGYKVGLTAASIVYDLEMKSGIGKVTEVVMAASLFLDMGLLLVRRFNKPVKSHTEISQKIYSRFLNRFTDIISTSNPEKIAYLEANEYQINLERGKSIIMYHHERVDGSGYFELEGHQRTMSLERLIAIVDEFYRLTSNHDTHSDSEAIVVKKKFTPKEAIDIIEEQVSQNKFDKELFKAFKRQVYPYPVYSLVYLNDGSQALVTKLNRDHPEKPIVYALESGETINLFKDESVEISSENKVNNLNLKKSKVKTMIGYDDDDRTITFILDKSYGKQTMPGVCPMCSGKVPFPDLLKHPFKIGDCLNEKTCISICEKGHPCIFTVLPPDNCELIQCTDGKSCPKDFKLFVEGYTHSNI